MTEREILGAALLAVPAIAITALLMYSVGWRLTLAIYAATAILTVCLLTGFELLGME